MDERENSTIGMLLDIEHIYGEHQGRLAPWLTSVCLACAPVLVYVYFNLMAVIPILLFIPIEIFFSLRVFMKIVGRENHRLQLYRKQLNDDYTSTADMLNVRTIHNDGLIEYLNGRVQYLVCCFNGTCLDADLRSVQIRRMLDAMCADFDYDIYIHNLTDSPALYEYYNKVNNFNKNQSAANFIDIIDHTIQLTEDTSVVQCTIFAIKGYKSDWKNMKAQIDTIINSRVSRAYKTIYRVDDAEVISDILNRNVDSVININDLLRRKYTTSQYDTSKVLAYDLPDDKEIIQGLDAAVKVITDAAPQLSFHKKYTEIADILIQTSTKSEGDL